MSRTFRPAITADALTLAVARATRAAGTVLVLALAALPRARAQQVAFAANVGADLDSATQAALTHDMARARERNIPLEPLVAKVREGRLKRAAGMQIRLAVSRLAARLDSARAALGPESSTPELVAGADALSAGATTSALRQLRVASTRPLVAPLGTLAQLVASGVPSRRAVEMIIDLLRKNATAAQILALGNLVETDVAAGLLAEHAAVIRLRGIEGSLVSGDQMTVTAAPSGTPPVNGSPPKPMRRP